MEENEIKNIIEEYIIQDKIDSAFSILRNWTHDNQIHITFVGLWGAYNLNEKEYRIGRAISYDDYVLHSNKLRYALIGLVGEVFSSKVDSYKKATNFMKLGAAKMETFDFPKAIEYFGKVIELIPNHIQAHMEIGVAKMNVSKFENAIVEFNKVLSLEPDNPFALNNRGVAYFQIGNSVKACNDWKLVESLGFDISHSAIKNHCS